MSQQVKPGDLAVIVRSPHAGNLGKIVRVGAAVAPGETVVVPLSTGELAYRTCRPGKPMYHTEPLGALLGFLLLPSRRIVTARGPAPFLAANLRPLRDTDGEDEILRIAGRPAPTEVKGFEDTTWMPLEGEQE